MTVFIMLQGVVALVVLNVLVSRFAARRNNAHRDKLNNDEMVLRQVELKILEAQRREHTAKQKIEALNDSIQLAQEHLDSAEKELDAARKAPPDLYYIFDRLEPKPGVIWEVTVSLRSDVPMSARMTAVWRQPRRYLIAAKTPREAHDRAAQRFFEKAGQAIDNVVACSLFVSKRSEAEAQKAASAGPRESRALTA